MTSPDRDLVFLTPIVPAATGNGLAMRSYLFLEAASAEFQVKVIVVPVAGAGSGAPPAGIRVLALPDRRQIAAALPELMGSARWRQRLSAASPLPPLAALAPATLAAAAERLAGASAGAPVHVTRSYLAPLGIALAELMGSDWATLDLDDDDEMLERSAGNDAAAASYSRLIGVFGPLFRRVALAAPAEAAAVAARHGLATSVLPNAVALPRQDPVAGSVVPRARARAVPAGGLVPAIGLLFVGNLTYWPNAHAAGRLVHEILPLVRRLTGRPVQVTLAGEAGADPALRALARVPGVTLTGFAPDLRPVYAAADVLVAPLAFGAGTRIKLLEAFSHGLPVVTTSVGAAGLGAVSGRHLLIADTPAELARAVAGLAADAGLRSRLAESALELVGENYSHDVVIPRIRGFFRGAAGGPAAGSEGRQVELVPRACLTADVSGVSRAGRNEPGPGQHLRGRGIAEGGGRPDSAQPVPRRRQLAQLPDGRGRHPAAGDSLGYPVAELRSASRDADEVEPAKD